MSATVRAEKLRETLARKLDSATMRLHEIREADKPRFSRHYEGRDYVVNFLHAARGVYPTVKTFAEAQMQPPAFKDWVEKWEAALPSDADRALWSRLADERRQQEHGEGAELVDILIEITEHDGSVQTFGQSAARTSATLGIPYEAPKVSKGGVRFAAYPDRPASEVCADYLKLCRQFADDFLRDQAHLVD